jgi:uncharacterized repeat protein (TIGR03803 family)
VFKSCGQFRHLIFAVFFCLVVLATTGPAHASSPKVKQIYSFAGGIDGQYPDTELSRDSVGNLYGTTESGGLYGQGTVFQVTLAGVHQVLYNFSGGSDGGKPSRGIYADWDGNSVYGTATVGGSNACPSGCGVFYRLAKTDDGSFAFEVIHTFDGPHDGSNPNSSLMFRGDPGRGFYGMTLSGGLFNAGTSYKVEEDPAKKWHLRVIHSFTGGTDGIGNSARFTSGPTFVMGVSPVGGVYGHGVIFELIPTAAGEWRYGTLYSFKGSPDGSSPSGGLVGYGNFYGVTKEGGAHGFGTIYEIKMPSGAERVIHDFEGGSDGGNPIAEPIAPTNLDYPIYGSTTTGGDATCGCGTLYRLFDNFKGGWNENIAQRMPGAPGLGVIYDQMLNLGGSGPFYGASVTGGTTNNGAIYEFDPF